MNTAISAITRTSRSIRRVINRIARRLTRKASIRLDIAVSVLPFVKFVLDYKADIGEPASGNHPGASHARSSDGVNPGRLVLAPVRSQPTRANHGKCRLRCASRTGVARVGYQPDEAVGQAEASLCGRLQHKVAIEGDCAAIKGRRDFLATHG